MAQFINMFRPGSRAAKAIALVCTVLLVSFLGYRLMNPSQALNTQTLNSSKINQTFLGGYLESWQDVLPRDIPESYNLIWFAFATVDGNGEIQFSHKQDKDKLIEDIAAFKASGKPVILSIGGSEGVKVAPAKGEIADKYYNGLRAIVDEYGFSGIDWDIEGEIIPFDDKSMDSIAGGMTDISYRLKDHYTANNQPFLITMAPYGAPQVIDTYQQAARDMLPILSMVNFQYYNDLEPPTYESVRDTLDSWKRLVPGLQNEQWSIGFMQKDNQQGYVTEYTKMREIWTDLQETRPGILGIWTWSIGTAEAPNGFPFQSELAPVVFGANNSSNALQ